MAWRASRCQTDDRGGEHVRPRVVGQIASGSRRLLARGAHCVPLPRPHKKWPAGAPCGVVPFTSARRDQVVIKWLQLETCYEN